MLGAEARHCAEYGAATLRPFQCVCSAHMQGVEARHCCEYSAAALLLIYLWGVRVRQLVRKV